MVNAVDLLCADTHVIARLKIADICFTTRGGEVFRRTRDRYGCDRLVVVFNNDGLVPDVPQCPDQRRRAGLAPLLRTALLRIPLARVPTGISAAHPR